MVLGNPFEQPKNTSSDRRQTGEGAALPFDRLAAHVADLVLLAPIMALAMAPFRRAVLEAKLLDNAYDSDWALIQGLVAAMAVGIAWETFFISMWGASPGRMIFGLRVVDVWTGEKPRPFHAFVRALTWWGSLLVLGAPFFGVYGNAKRRPLHDRVGDTEVRSRNTRRQSSPPQITELAFGSLFTTGAIFFASLVLTSQMYVLREHARMAGEKNQPRLCADVTSTLESWEGGPSKPTRIAAAISLSAAGATDSSCLEVEAEYALWNNQGRTLGYLAKGLIRFGTDDDEAEQYFSKVCDLEPDSDACKMVGWFRLVASENNGESEMTSEMTGETTEHIEKLARSMVPSEGRTARAQDLSPDWLRLLVLRELFVQKADANLILKLTEFPAKHEVVGAKLVEYRTRALWRLDQKSKAKATFFATADALPRRQRVVLTSWLCSRELYESSCSKDALRACEMMERSADADSGDTAVPSFIVASLRNTECRILSGRGSTRAFDDIEKQVDGDTGKTLIEAVRALRTDGADQGLIALRNLASKDGAEEDLFVTEANIRLIEEVSRKPMTDRDATLELVNLRERWFASRNALRYSDWGRALFEALAKREQWGKAAEVGILLSGEYDSDRSLQKRIALAAWKSGKRQWATELAESLDKTRFPASLGDPSENSLGRDDGPSLETLDEKLFDSIRKSGRSK